MKVTWFRLICVVLTAEYVRERFISVASNQGNHMKSQGWRMYANATLPLALFVEMMAARFKLWLGMNP